MSRIIKFASTLGIRRTEILGWCDYYLSKERINNKIKAMKRQTYGYIDQKLFELKYYQGMTLSTDLSDKLFNFSNGLVFLF